MRRSVSLLAVAVCVIGLAGCESPDEKPAQEMLQKARDAKYRGATTDALLTAFKVSERYPKTKAAGEAKRLADDIAEATKKEVAEREARNKRIAEKIKDSKALLATLHSKVDDMKQITWYGDKGARSWVLGRWIKLYFGISEKGGTPSLMPLRFQAQYQGSNWIFARTVSVKVGGKVYEVSPDDWHHDNSADHVWETCDVPLSATEPQLLAALGGGGEVKLRFEGRQRYSDFVVPKLQLQAAKHVYDVWKAIDDAGSAKP